MDTQHNQPAPCLRGRIFVRLRLTWNTRHDRQGRMQQCYILVPVEERGALRLGESA
jgi:hypothetical protein